MSQVDPSGLMAAFSSPYPATLLLLFLLALLRLLPIIVQAPFWGAGVLTNPIKWGLGLSLAMVFMPQLAYLTTEPLNFDLHFVLLAIKELFIGAVLGFFIAVPFNITSTAGTLIDHQRGISSFLSLDPTTGTQVSPLGRLYGNVMIYTFFLVRADQLFLDSLSRSWNLIPPAKLLNAKFFTNSNAFFWETAMSVLSEVMRIGVQLAAPAIVTIFMSDLFLGVANRLAQQVPMAFLGWALKSLLGIGVLWAGWLFIAQQFGQLDFDWIKVLNQLLPTFAID